MKKRIRPAIIILTVVLLAVSSLFGIWMLLPAKQFTIAVWNKNVTMGKIDRHNNITVDYRKHIGLFWILKNSRCMNPETGTWYDPTADYYGPRMDAANNIIGEKDLSEMGPVPDMIYLSDGYAEDSESSVEGGITRSDIETVTAAYEKGSHVVGEFNILPLADETEVRQEIEALFGIRYSGWIGRYVSDLSDRTDVPDWARTIYKAQYGKEWDVEGAGLLLVSVEGELMVLLQGIDYAGYSVLVKIQPDYEAQFGRLSEYFYNWFELVEEKEGTAVVARYRLPLTEAGEQKFSSVAEAFDFPAVTKRTQGSSFAYYFAGDFCDYAATVKYSGYLFAAELNRIFYFHKTGDITEFYWDFYVPLMSGVLDEACRSAAS